MSSACEKHFTVSPGTATVFSGSARGSSCNGASAQQSEATPSGGRDSAMTSSDPHFRLRSEGTGWNEHLWYQHAPERGMRRTKTTTERKRAEAQRPVVQRHAQLAQLCVDDSWSTESYRAQLNLMLRTTVNLHVQHPQMLSGQDADNQRVGHGSWFRRGFMFLFFVCLVSPVFAPVQCPPRYELTEK